jgi:hypothetical protein
MRVILQQYLNTLCVESKRLSNTMLDTAMCLFEEDPDYYLGHVAWMCAETKDLAQGTEDERNKANRWLGFIQGCLWSSGFYSINAMRDHNRTHPEQDPQHLVIHQHLNLEGVTDHVEIALQIDPAEEPVEAPDPITTVVHVRMPASADYVELRLSTAVKELLSSLDEATSNTPIELERTLVVSYMNVTKKELDLLFVNPAVATDENKYFALFRVNTDEVDDILDGSPMGENVKAIALYAREMGCSHLKLEQLGEVLPGFPVFDW